MKRLWLDWGGSLIPTCVAWLIDQHTVAGRCDLRQVRCVLPGARAGRLLLRELVARCSARKIRLVPPRTLTPGTMVDVLAPPTRETASRLECSLAWMHVLRDADRTLVAPLFPRPPDRADWPAWHEFATKIVDVAEELAGELLGFGDVARCAEQLDMDREAARWRVLEHLHPRYHQRLADCGREDPHARRRKALDDLEPEPGDALVLIGVVELNRVQRKAVAAFGDQTTILVHAPESEALGFDPFGCVVPEYWRAREIDVPDEQILFADRPSDQAQAVVECLAGLGGAYRPEQIAIGLGDDTLAPALGRAGDWASLVIHDPRGRPVVQSRPYRLLAAGIDWLRDPRIASFATLVRHPDVERWIDGRAHPRGPDGEDLLERPPVDDPAPARLSRQDLGDSSPSRSAAASEDRLPRTVATPTPRERPPLRPVTPFDDLDDGLDCLALGGEPTAPSSGRARLRLVEPLAEASGAAPAAAFDASAPQDAAHEPGDRARPGPADGADLDFARAGAPVDLDELCGAPIEREPDPAELDALLAEAAPFNKIRETGPEGQHAAAPRGPARTEWLTILDRYYAEHLHDLESGPFLGEPVTRRRLAHLHDAVRRLFAPLAGPRKSLTDWLEPILDVLRNAFGDLETATSRRDEANAVAACIEIARALGGLASAAPELQPEVDAAAAVRLCLTYAAGLRIPEDPRTGQIEMLGWLDLHHDTSPALLLCGFNDGAIPQAVTADAFLPDALRSAVGVLNNRRRYARDAYLFEAIRASRERVTIVAGRVAADGEPLTPSRLLLAGPIGTLPRRVMRLCDRDNARRWALPRGAPPAGARSAFQVPAPPPGEPVLESMSVTEFGWYLRCPFRYWLKYVQRLRVVDDAGVELDALQFGNLTHEVLERLGLEPRMVDSTDRTALRAFLDEALDELARDKYGSRPLPAIRIQLRRLRARLHAFAKVQADRRADGWRIERCEFVLPEDTYLAVPGGPPMKITGKIDRLDRNVRDGSWMIIDYKTSESGKRPESTHQQRARSGEKVWTDLQLPLYHHLAAQHGVAGRVQLAYINLPKKPDDVRIEVAKWAPSDLAAAIEAAREIVRKIRAGSFEMADDYPGHYQDDFANICQTGVFGGGLDELDGDGSEVSA